MITRCYAINRDIDGDFPGIVCHSARLAQRNLPTKHELERKGLNSEKVLEIGSDNNVISCASRSYLEV